MSDDFMEEDPGLLDDDPALDFILYNEMGKEEKKPRQKSGCSAVIIFLLFPTAIITSYMFY